MNECKEIKQVRKPFHVDDELISLANAVSGIIREEEKREYDNRKAQEQNYPFGY
jgi:hypothetical protein